MYAKQDKRETKNGGWILKMELIDSMGTAIEAVAFGDAAEFWDRKIQQGKVYLVSGAQVKTANKKFSNVKNDFNLVIDQKTKFEETQAEGIAQVVFEFTKIKALGN